MSSGRPCAFILALVIDKLSTQFAMHVPGTWLYRYQLITEVRKSVNNVHNNVAGLVEIIDWISDIRCQGCAVLHSLVKCVRSVLRVAAYDAKY